MFFKNFFPQYRSCLRYGLFLLLGVIGSYFAISRGVPELQRLVRTNGSVSKTEGLGSPKCIFCNISPTSFVLEKESLFVIRDIAPRAKTHLLIIPKRHVRNTKSLNPELDFLFWRELLLTVQQLAATLDGEQSFVLENHNEKKGKQTVFHLHWHFLSDDLLVKT